MHNTMKLFRKTAAVMLCGAVFFAGCGMPAADPSADVSTKLTAGSEEAAENVVSSSDQGGQESLSAVSVSEEKWDPDEAETKLNEILSGDLTDSRVLLDVPEIFQNPEMPTGCEATALTIDLNALGYDVDKEVIAREYMPYDTNLAVGYAGDPFSSAGAGIFPTGLLKTAENYLKTTEDGDQVAELNTTGTSLEDLFKVIQAGYPVLIWTTMYMADPGMTDMTYSDGTNTYNWYYEEHCVLMYGYDTDENAVFVSDPLEGLRERDLDEFETLFDEIGDYSAVLMNGTGVKRNMDNLPDENEEADEGTEDQHYNQVQQGRQQTQQEISQGIAPAAPSGAVNVDSSENAAGGDAGTPEPAADSGASSGSSAQTPDNGGNAGSGSSASGTSGQPAVPSPSGGGSSASSGAGAGTGSSTNAGSGSGADNTGTADVPAAPEAPADGGSASEPLVQ